MDAEQSFPMSRDTLCTLLFAAIRAYDPSYVRVVQVRRWFGPRWVGFAGKARGAAGVHTRLAVVPPFNPARIAAEIDLLAPEGMGVQPPLHGPRPSEQNLRSMIRGVAPKGTLAAWISTSEEGARAGVGRASLMVYLVPADPEGVEPVRWYVQCSGESKPSLMPQGIGWDELRWIRSFANEGEAERTWRGWMAGA